VAHGGEGVIDPFGLFATLVMITFQFENSSVTVFPSSETLNVSSLTVCPSFFSTNSMVRSLIIVTLIVSYGWPGV
jgi:hypothetical protein